MLRNLGMGELIVILLIVVLIFGATRLPQLGESIGKAIRGFKRGISTDDDIDVSPSKQKRVAAKSSAEDVEAEEVETETAGRKKS